MWQEVANTTPLNTLDISNSTVSANQSKVENLTLLGCADNLGSGAIGSVGAGSANGAAGVESAGLKDIGFGLSFSISAILSAGSS